MDSVGKGVEYTSPPAASALGMGGRSLWGVPTASSSPGTAARHLDVKLGLRWLVKEMRTDGLCPVGCWLFMS